MIGTMVKIDEMIKMLEDTKSKGSQVIEVRGSITVPYESNKVLVTTEN